MKMVDTHVVIAEKYDCCTAEVLIARIQEKMKEVPDDQRAGARIELEAWDEYDITCAELRLNFKRPQTAKEWEAEQKQVAEQEKWAREQYEQLKKKFESE